MRAFVITVRGSRQSEDGAAALRSSSERVDNTFKIETWDATTPATVESEMADAGLVWNYPWTGEEWRPILGLKLHAYKTRNPLARMACFMSHYRLWNLAQAGPALILEDDALFLRKLDPAPLLESEFLAIGINDPKGATRKPDVFHRQVQAQPEEIGPAPWIDSAEVPQGLAGASAYLMKPEAGTRAVELAKIHGAWPNDALLCRQLAPWLGVTRTYYTTIQKTPSSTSR